MKNVKLAMLLVVAAFSVCNAQTRDSLGMPTFDGQSIGIQEVVKVDSLSKKQIYDRAKMFFVETFKSAKDVIQLDDPDAGTIIGKGNASYSYFNVAATAVLTVYFTIKIEVKDNRYRYTITDIRYGQYKLDPAEFWNYPKMNKKHAAALGAELRNIEKLLLKSMNAVASDF